MASFVGRILMLFLVFVVAPCVFESSYSSLLVEARKGNHKSPPNKRRNPPRFPPPSPPPPPPSPPRPPSDSRRCRPRRRCPPLVTRQPPPVFQSSSPPPQLSSSPPPQLSSPPPPQLSSPPPPQLSTSPPPQLSSSPPPQLPSSPPPQLPSSPPPQVSNFPPPPSSASLEQQEWLNPHNDARSLVGSPPLVWNEIAAQSARYWAQYLGEQNNCKMMHGNNTDLGQNLAWYSGGPVTIAGAVKLWVDEGKLYSRDVFPNGCSTGSWEDCGHYTQVVWKTTTSVGCAYFVCSTGGTMYVCNYSPPGNFDGLYPY